MKTTWRNIYNPLFLYTGEEETLELRRRLLHVIILLLLIIAIPAYFFSLARHIPNERWGVIVFNTIMVLTGFIAFLIRRRLPFTLLASIMLITFYIWSVMILGLYGMTGAGLYALIAMAIFSTLLFGPRLGWITIIFGILAIVGVGLLTIFGTLEVLPSEALLTFTRQPKAWIFAVTVFVMMTGFTTTAYQLLQHKLMNMVIRQKEAADELQSANRQLIRKIEQHEQAEQEKQILEEQLRQAQKMEAIGRLAGGVAHDFNNLLTGINGYAEMSLASLKPDDPLHAQIEEILKAGRRAAELTNQLLAFGRKQIIHPEVLDVNVAVSHLQKILKRIIGEDLMLAFLPGQQLWRVHIDPGQLDQILINLISNARDAMPDGGAVTIATTNRTLESKIEHDHTWLSPGDYVQLTVSDTGVGMSDETMQHIFEPFFSTKHKSRGTGLGLATVYGIVEQNNGLINVISKPGEGTTFEVLLPRSQQTALDRQEESDATPRRGRETVLLVEDEDVVRNLAWRLLTNLGYQVLSAADGEDALKSSESHPGDIDLLLTDVIMPRMNGRQLYQRLLQKRPAMKALFMSGYPETHLAPHGVLAEDMNFLQKPFTVESLARKLHDVFDN